MLAVNAVDVSLPYEAEFSEHGIAARDHGWWQNRANLDLEESGSKLRRATEVPALPQGWKDYFRKRLWNADA
jgi:hypothetical protein